MLVTGYAYPWDVLEPGFTERARELGVDEVAVATSYHSARAATPWSTTTTSVIAPNAAFYRPVRDDAWASATLRPDEANWTEGTDSAGTALRSAKDAGFATAAWIVLTHSTRLGSGHPGMAVRNCFGETYPWALCPSRPEVRTYAATLTVESVRDLDVDTVVLEACGQLGLVHQCQHEKTDGVWSPAIVKLLSVCCCDGCTARWSGSGEHVVEQLRVAALRLIAEGDLTATRTGVPDELLDEVLAGRQASTDALRTEVLDALHAKSGPRPAITLHAAADPWVTGALPGLTPAAGKQIDSAVLSAWQPGEATLSATRQARAELPDGVAVGSYVTAVAAQPLADPPAYVRALRSAGSTELHLYHLGLASPARWPDLRATSTAAHR
jgi:hypothetical protein